MMLWDSEKIDFVLYRHCQSLLKLHQFLRPDQVAELNWYELYPDYLLYGHTAPRRPPLHHGLPEHEFMRAVTLWEELGRCILPLDTITTHVLGRPIRAKYAHTVVQIYGWRHYDFEVAVTLQQIARLAWQRSLQHEWYFVTEYIRLHPIQWHTCPMYISINDHERKLRSHMSRFLAELRAVFPQAPAWKAYSS